MTEQERHDDMPPPGRPLWLAAEDKRLAEGWSIVELCNRAGIGRMTYGRLATNTEPPIARTVKRIADAIGMDYKQAAQLAGLPQEAGQLPALTGSFHGTVRQADVDIQILVRRVREIANRTGQTLGDVLVDMGLARPGELTVTGDEVVREIAGDDLPDDLKRQFLDGYRQLREQVAAADARRRGNR